jgi:DNA-binding CsgD family transcriptional regulator
LFFYDLSQRRASNVGGPLADLRAVAMNDRSPTAEPTAYSFVNLVDAIGTDRIAQHLLLLFQTLWGAESYSLHKYDGDCVAHRHFISLRSGDTFLRQLASLGRDSWRRDAALYQRSYKGCQNGKMLAAVELQDVGQGEEGREFCRKTGLRERIIVCGGQIGKPMTILNIFAGSEPTSAKKIEDVRASAQLLISILAKHEEISATRVANRPSLSSLKDIVCRLKGVEMRLSPRELDVCARIIRGLTTVGIALDLGIGVETVIEYRKRLYRRLGVSSQHELLAWYLR